MRRLSQFLIVFTLGVVYSLTIAPDLTWSHFSADGGDLIAAVAVNGVPHPAGYPLYLLLAKFFQYLPVGSLAFRTNLFSAVCTVLAALVLFNLIREQLRESPFHDQLALLGALAYGVAPAVWAQALVTEVYALHGLLIVLCLRVFTKDNLRGGEWSRGFVFGLAATNHLTSVLLFPLLLLSGDIKKIILRLSGVAGGLLLYLSLPLRAAGNPPVNWGDASTLDGFFWLVGGAAYRGYTFQLSFFDIIDRMRAAAGLALEQFTLVGLFFAVYSLLGMRSVRVLLPTVWSASIFLIFSVVYASYDSHVYLIVSWLCIAVWAAQGLGDLLQLLSRYSESLARLTMVFTLVLLFARIPFTYKQVDLSHDAQAQEFIAVTLEKIPNQALVLVTGDEQVFALWYAQFAQHRREDIVIVAEGLLQFDWYPRTLKHIYPNLSVPETETTQSFDLLTANPQYSVCYVSPEAVECP